VDNLGKVDERTGSKWHLSKNSLSLFLIYFRLSIQLLRFLLPSKPELGMNMGCSDNGDAFIYKEEESPMCSMDWFLIFIAHPFP
jgi:hypothetical protein